jgi:RNA polymerase sigma-70 factor (ECF subfamily)
LYLLFNEGYHGASSKSVVRAELCAEAMRLTDLLREHPPAATPTTNALAALMRRHAARLPARPRFWRDLSPLLDQDRFGVDARLIADGLSLMESVGHGPKR